MKRTMVEALVFFLVACAVGFGVNAQSDNGLDLWRNHFPARGGGQDSTTSPNPPTPQAHTPPPNGRLTTAVHPDHEFQTVTLEQAHEFFEVGDSSVLFIDARNDDGYRCRIPYAVQFFHYYPQRYLQDLLTVLPDAQTIVIYCNGGDCEDSVQAARYLTSELPEPVEYDRVYVFEGGIQAWAKAGYSLEPENCVP